MLKQDYQPQLPTVPRNLQELLARQQGRRSAWWKWLWNGWWGKSAQRDVELIAYVRFGAEELTLRQSLASLLPVITKGVLVYHRLPATASPEMRASHERSIAIARDFATQHRGFKLVEYPHVVYGANHPRYFEHQRICERISHGIIPTQDELNLLIPAESCLDRFYHFAWEQACQIATATFPYIMKVDADHIYHAPTLAQQLQFLRTARALVEILYLPKYNLFYSPTRDQLYFNAVCAVNDHYIQLIDTCKYTMSIESKFDWQTGELCMRHAQAYEVTHFVPRDGYPDRPELLSLKQGLQTQNFLTRYLLQEQVATGGDYVRGYLQRYGLEFVGNFGFTAEQAGKCLQTSELSEWLAVVRDLPTSSLAARNEHVLPSYTQAEQEVPRAAYNQDFCDFLQEPEQAELVSQVTTSKGKISSRKLARYMFREQWRLHYRQGMAWEQIPLGTSYPLTCAADSEIHWVNSVHFYLQKRLQNSGLVDYSDEQLQQMHMVPFAAFVQSDLFRELQQRCPSFTADSWLVQHDYLLNLARSFYHQP